MRKEIRDGFKMLLIVLVLIGLRLGFCCITWLIIIWLRPYLGIVLAVILGFLAGGILITITGTWQWQIESKTKKGERTC